MKKIIVTMLLCVLFINSIIVYAGTDTNMGGGGSNGGTDNVTGDYNIVGNMDDERNVGVRVTLVDSITGARKSKSIDFANNHRKPVVYNFGAVNKLEYLGGKNLSIKNNEYQVKEPTIPLPKIIGGNMGTIKKYFGSENVLKYIGTEVGIPFDEIISVYKDGKHKGKGKYKLLIEPVGYPLVKGSVVACTATELAMYNKKLNNAIRKSQIMNFSHDNLPLSIFLEKDDLGIKKWNGADKGRQSDNDIIKQLGVGIVSFDGEIEEEEPPSPPTSIDVVYHEDTEVITSIEFNEYWNPKENSREDRDNRMPTPSVNFSFDAKDKIKILQDGTKDLVNKGTIYPFVKWKTPKLDKKGKPKIVKIKVVVGLPEPDHYSEKGNPVGQKKEEIFINAKIIRLQENTPPNPDVPDPEETSKGEGWVDSWFYQRPDYQTMTRDIENNNLKSYYIPSNYTKKDTNSWNSYEVEEIYIPPKNPKGKGRYKYLWTTYTYTATLVLEPNIFPPHSTVRTQYWDNENGWSMKSGYGIDQHTKAIMKIKVEKEEEQEKGKPIKSTYFVDTTDWTTKAQGGVSFFSDFNLARGDNNKPKYWRILEACDTWDETPWNENDKLTDVNDDKINTNILQFKKNRFSTYNNRTHFTPLWYADDERYWVTTYVYDAWTRATRS